MNFVRYYCQKSMRIQVTFTCRTNTKGSGVVEPYHRYTGQERFHARATPRLDGRKKCVGTLLRLSKCSHELKRTSLSLSSAFFSCLPNCGIKQYQIPCHGYVQHRVVRTYSSSNQKAAHSPVITYLQNAALSDDRTWLCMCVRHRLLSSVTMVRTTERYLIGVSFFRGEQHEI